MALGTLRLPLPGGKYYEVVGGPSIENPHTHVFVKMAKEINIPCDINIPTQDFKTPPKVQMNQGVRDAIHHIVAGRKLYVGCMAGRGRTGLFLAVLAKAWGIRNPVEYVREHYYAHAVETDEQYDYVMNFHIDADLKRTIKFAKLKSLFRLKSNLTDRNFRTQRESLFV
jgi:protein-tyrosine phosphatase